MQFINLKAQYRTLKTEIDAEELLNLILREGSGPKCGKDFDLSFSLEWIGPGNLICESSNIPKVEERMCLV